MKFFDYFFKQLKFYEFIAVKKFLFIFIIFRANDYPYYKMMKSITGYKSVLKFKFGKE